MLHATLRGRQARAALPALIMAAALAAVAAPGRAAAAPDPAQAEELARSGRHAEAARRYEELAKQGLLSWDARLSLLAAREHAAAHEYDDAERMLGHAEGRARGDDAVLLARIEAEIALARNDPKRALAALGTLPDPLPAPQASDLLALRGQAAFAAGEPLTGLRAYEERGRLLGSAAARHANDQLLVDQLLLHPANVKVPAEATDLERGWLEFGQLLSGSADPATLERRGLDWRARHPGHPAAQFLPATPPVASAGATVPPIDASGVVALLLPLSGRHAATGVAVRDGFMGAWYATPPAARPRVRVYDTAAGAPAAYQRAIAEGARLVVGPLIKEEVAAVAGGQGLPVPTLALNAYASRTPPPFLYQFSLDPEQEAQAVARRIAADGLTHGIALLPQSPWGERVGAAFTAALEATGTTHLTSVQYYEPGSKDFSGPVRAGLGRFGGAGERNDAHGHSAPHRDSAAESQAGPQFAFVAATAAVARAIRPQMRFQMSYDLPIYATSDAWDPSVPAAADMDGMIFPEMPWIIEAGQGAPALWDVTHSTWATESRGRLRLYAFGFDAFGLAQELRGPGRTIGLQGLTGGLEIGRDGRIERRLQFARIEGGKPEPLGSGLTALPSPTTGSSATP